MESRVNFWILLIKIKMKTLNDIPHYLKSQVLEKL